MLCCAWLFKSNGDKKMRDKMYLDYLHLKQHKELFEKKIAEWDELAKDNEGNKHNLSTSERQDWVDKLRDLNIEC